MPNLLEYKHLALGPAISQRAFTFDPGHVIGDPALMTTAYPGFPEHSLFCLLDTNVDCPADDPDDDNCTRQQINPLSVPVYKQAELSGQDCGVPALAYGLHVR